MKYIKNRVQLFNPRAKYWVKINTETGCVIGHKLTPYKNVRKRIKVMKKRKKIAWITKTKIKIRRGKTKYCCEMMQYAMGEAKVIRYSVLPAIGHIEISYCPWCRKKLKTIFEVKK